MFDPALKRTRGEESIFISMPPYQEGKKIGAGTSTSRGIGGFRTYYYYYTLLAALVE
jgi:hypothetical protein